MAEQGSLFRGTVEEPVTVCAGLGVDSTAMLVGMAMKGIRPDLILFSDTGAEKKETYEFVPILDEWLAKEGFPPITTVRYIPKNCKNFPPYVDAETNFLTNGTLPGVAFGPSTCSHKFKKGPQHTFIKSWEPAIRAWQYGLRVKKLIGFDNGKRDRQRTFAANPNDTHLYDYQMPLQQWAWDREECQRQIARAGLPIPVKSSCWFCVAMKPHEVSALPVDLLRRIVRLEARAHPRLKTCEGLWRSTVKGVRGGVPHPGSMTQFIREKKLLPAWEIDYIWETTWKNIVSFQEGFAMAKEYGTIDAFLEANAGLDYRHAVRVPTADRYCEAA